MRTVQSPPPWSSLCLLCCGLLLAGCPDVAERMDPQDGGRFDAGGQGVTDAGGDREEDAGQPVEPIADAGTPQTPDAGEPLPGDPNPISAENAKPGTPNWRITRPSWQREIEGYAATTSVEAGSKIGFKIALSAKGPYSWRVYRLGYYGGIGAREVLRGGPEDGYPQADCPLQRDTGLVACDWIKNLEVRAGTDWTRGVYLLRLTREDGRQAYVPFLVRNSQQRAEVLMSVPTGTWQAYNKWGGESLYDDAAGVMPSGRAFQVSSDRPYHDGHGAGQLLKYDLSMLTWLEAQGLAVEYATTEDLDRAPERLSMVKAILLSGHDEYVTARIRTGMDQAVASGTSLLSLGANQLYWQIRLSAAPDGRERRVVTCYKGDAPRLDPVGPTSPELTVKFRQAPVRRPENALLGSMFNARWHQFAFPQLVTNAGHWAFAGTGLKNGELLWQVNGYEVDSIVPGTSQPAVEILAEAPLLSLQEAFGYGQMVIHQKDSGAWVFNAGGNDFVNALSSGHMTDPRVGRMVANILYRGLGRSVPSSLVSFPASSRPAPVGPFATLVSTVAGIPGEPGALDGPLGTGRLGAVIAVAPLPGGALATLDALSGTVMRVEADGSIRTPNGPAMTGPMGLAADAAGNIYVSDTALSAIRLLRPDGTHEVLAGLPGAPGAADGERGRARFRSPAGMTLGPDGALYVADMDNGVIRRIDLNSPNKTVSTVPSRWMYRPSGVAVGADGTLYVVESGEARVLAIRGPTTQLLAGGEAGYADGTGESAELMPYLGIAVLADGSVAVSDPGSYRIRRLTGQVMTTLAGSGKAGHRDGAGDLADFVLPAGLVIGADGRLLVADSGNGLIRAIIP
ncbi:MAG: hemolysin [Myxococcota bacterium]|nr:hemolysin [Myxococcota bacterium]